jgi:hypothetical protein
LYLSAVLPTLLRAGKESSADVVMDRTVIAANLYTVLHYHCKLFFFLQVVKKQWSILKIDNLFLHWSVIEYICD